MVYRVTRQQWVDGRLQTENFTFEDETDAATFARQSDQHHVKVYDSSGALSHEKPLVPPTTNLNNNTVVETYI